MQVILIMLAIVMIILIGICWALTDINNGLKREIEISQSTNEALSDECLKQRMRADKLASKLYYEPEKKSRWVKEYKSGTKVSHGYVCLCCDMWHGSGTHFCPHCGIKMEGQK